MSHPHTPTLITLAGAADHPHMPPSYLRWLERYAGALAPVAGPFLEALSEISRALADASNELRPYTPATDTEDDSTP